MKMRKIMYCSLPVFVSLALFPLVALSQTVVTDFEDLDMSFWNGSTGAFISGEASFNNSYNPTWGSWDGWAYSNRTDTTSRGYQGQYNAIAGGGQGGSSIYGICYISAFASEPPRMMLTNTTDGYILAGAYFTNTNYTYYSMLDGDAFAKKFGGSDGTEPDWLKLDIKGVLADGSVTDKTVEFYLADFRSDDSREDYIIKDWSWVDLHSLGPVKGLEFSMESSDVGAFGINTPTYFAMDTVLVPEPMALLLLGMGGLFLRRRYTHCV